MDIDEIRDQLLRKGLQEVSHVERFEAWKEVSAGTARVYIEVQDRGPHVDRQLRFSASVHAEDGELLITGNPDPTVEETLEFLHWNELDAKLSDWIKRHP